MPALEEAGEALDRRLGRVFGGVAVGMSGEGLAPLGVESIAAFNSNLLHSAAATDCVKDLQRKLEAVMQIVFTTLMIAALGVVLFLFVLMAGLGDAVILLPAFLAVGFTIHQEVAV